MPIKSTYGEFFCSIRMQNIQRGFLKWNFIQIVRQERFQLDLKLDFILVEAIECSILGVYGLFRSISSEKLL